MNRAVLERVRALHACLLLLQSLWGCAAAQDATQGPWTRAAPMPTARSELAATALEGRIYVAGGIAQWGTTAAFEGYDPTTDRWEELPPLPEAVHHLAAAATDDRIYVTGGYTNLLFSEITKRAWAYDPGARRWTGIADLPGPRAAHGMAAIEGRLYVVGGIGPASKEIWLYDPASDRWEAAPAPLPTQREHLAVTVLDGKLYAVGGRWGDAGNLAALEIYDPAKGTWTRGPDLPTARSGLTAGVLEGHVHVTGGESLSLGRTFGEHEAYAPTTARWTAFASLPTPRHGLASAVVSGRWYVIGGGTRAGAMTFISLTDLVRGIPWQIRRIEITVSTRRRYFSYAGPADAGMEPLPAPSTRSDQSALRLRLGSQRKSLPSGVTMRSRPPRRSKFERELPDRCSVTYTLGRHST